jgi:hypothetical protein
MMTDMSIFLLLVAAPIVLYAVVRIISTAYFHSKHRFLKEFKDGIQGDGK